MGSTDRGPGGETQGWRERGSLALVVLALIAVGAVVTYLGPILKPFLIAVFLFFSTRSAVDALIRLRSPPWLAYLALFAAATALTALLMLFVSGEALAFRDQWPKYQERILVLIGGDIDGPRRSLQEVFEVSSKEAVTFLFGAGVGAVEVLLMVFFYLLFLILGGAKVPGRVRRAFPGERAEHILAVAGRISDSMGRFMKVKTAVSLGMGASAALLMYLFHLEHWLLWGFLFFALNYITYLGSLAACVPPVVLAYLALDPVQASVLAVLIVANRFLWIDYLEIRWSGKHLNIDSVLLFLWLAYWGWAWGVLGLILAFPMITSLKVVLEHLESTKAWAVLMSED